MTQQPEIRNAATDSISVEKKVAFLSSPLAYPRNETRVEVIETHMSWVFMTERFVYKLKKRVRTRFADLRLLDARLRNCREEMLLNKRLAAGVYLGIVPLCLDRNRGLMLGGKGQVVDWLVLMRRLSSGEMLDQLIRNKMVDGLQLRRAALLLANFYTRQPPIFLSASGYREKLRAEIQVTYRHLIHPAYSLSCSLIETLTAGLLSFLTTNAAVFDRRTEEGRIRELHGDLRPEQIWLGAPPAIIDCLELNKELRVLDTAEELPQGLAGHPAYRRAAIRQGKKMGNCGECLSPTS
jgi:aminoglycoside phosphotransferase family enzyme